MWNASEDHMLDLKLLKVIQGEIFPLRAVQENFLTCTRVHCSALVVMELVYTGTMSPLRFMTTAIRKVYLFSFNDMAVCSTLPVIFSLHKYDVQIILALCLLLKRASCTKWSQQLFFSLSPFLFFGPHDDNCAVLRLHYAAWYFSYNVWCKYRV